GDVPAALAWEGRWRAAVLATGDADRLAAGFRLVHGERIAGWVGLVLGYGGCGLWLLRKGEVRPVSHRQRILNVSFGLPIALLLAATTQIEGPAGAAAVALARLAGPGLLFVVLPGWTERWA
ncbi:MAG: hypothetical protein R3190_15370, partial [Thermoanaerobaculia bacterium]|nr:hypothetical protein [Thermoanaerobaculia bacterium]